MVKTVITVCDYGKIEGGAAKVAIESAIAMTDIVEDSILFHAVGKADPELEKKGVRVVALGQCDILNNPNRLGAVIQGIWNNKAAAEFKKLLLTKNPKETVIHVHSWTKALSASVFRVSERLGFKVVLTIHDYFLACPNGGFFNYKTHKICKYKPLSAKCIACNCDSRGYFHKLWRVVRQIVQNNAIRKRKNISYIFISDFSKNILIRYMEFKNSYRVNNPIQIKDRIKVDASQNDTYLYIGRLSEEKGVKLFCQAVSELGVNAAVVGDGCLRAELEQKYPDIEFAGWQNYDGVRNYILKARCLVFPSLWYEGSPLTIPEVQAFGIPCVVSDKCAGRDFVADTLTFNPDDIESLKDKLKPFKDNVMTKRVSDSVFELFDDSVVSSKFYVNSVLHVYNSVL